MGMWVEGSLLYLFDPVTPAWLVAFPLQNRIEQTEPLSAYVYSNFSTEHQWIKNNS